MRNLSSLIAALAAIGVMALGVAKGSTVAGGADSSGYLSEAAMIAQGRLTQSRPLAQRVPWPEPEWTLAPLGWRKGMEPGTIAPVYAAGYPIVIAGARLIAGPRAMFWVVPVLGALAVWFTFLLGRRLDGPTTGALAALLLATSPPFMFQVLQPLSDVPATAWWIVAIVLASQASSFALVGSGVAASLAVLTRPNLAPIGAAVGLYLGARFWFGVRPRRRMLPPLLFGVPFAAACLAVGWLQNHLYGSPLLTGYGDPDTLYAWANYTPNLHRYTRWLFESETRLVLAGLIAPIVLLRRRSATPIDPDRMRLTLLSVAVPLIVFASYLFYVPFDNWTFLRFLIPGYPALFALAVLSVRRAAESLGSRAGFAFTVIVCAVIVLAHVKYIDRTSALAIVSSERRYERMVEYVRTRVAGHPAIIGEQHTGSLAYYTGVPTIRWIWLDEKWLDEAIADLRGRGYRPMIMLDEWEENAFRPRFGEEQFGKLDWPPHAQITGPPLTHLYDPADRERFLAGERWTPEEIK